MPSRTVFAVDRMRRADQSAVTGMLARAFYDDPLFGFFLPDHVRQTRGLLAFMRAGIADAKPFGEIWIAHNGDRVASAAVWLPPNAYPRGARRETMSMARSVPSFVYAGRRVGASMQLLSALDRAHKDVGAPHYYLAILGTDPLDQRMGAGSAALAPVLQRCDGEGIPAYLETQKEENLAYYQRHAFQLVRKVETGSCPPVWTMLREP
jgi:hypothetical protein